ncbi:MAG: LL-diaminopimelate aminotransferase [Dehalococcoidia bacterium]|nr:LL-diaminopimelate aminotransferase [Dehalococcoidia bacterium]MDD5494757.1 LL-diaminopimelate aminotransferase [Dehalococcoidia bacterium]
MRLSRRLDKIPPYLFVEINRKIAEKKARGEDVISFAIGDPDLPTPAHIVERLCAAAHDPANHRYPETFGLPDLCKAIAAWYKDRFGVTLDWPPTSEVLPLIGSKEGVGHMSFCMLDPGDVALVPDPGYPVYSVSTLLAGGEIHYMPLLEENGFLPDLDAIPAAVLKKAKLLWICYPNNPTGAVAGLDFFAKVVAFARKNDLAVCHDAPYTEVAFDGYKPHSFLEAPGAMDVGVEFHSLSKTYNMTGWRIGMAVGNRTMVDALFRFKSNLDSGIPQAIQIAAIEALTSSQSEIPQRNEKYQKRRDLLVNALEEMGLKVTRPKAGFYIWAGIPAGYTSVQYAAELLDKIAVAVTPGIGYGKSGEGYIRLSITQPDDRFNEGVRRLLTLKSAH